MLNSILSTAAASLTLKTFLICTGVSLMLGVITALLHMYKNRYSKNFIVTLSILPAVVQVIIMLVNGNLGTGVAVMGAFGLVRFRSTPGNSREIGSIFIAMAIGLATGMGFIGVAVLFLLIAGVFSILVNSLSFGEQAQKELKITIPENLDYNGIFDDLFEEYAKTIKLLKVKTCNMGSLFELQYRMILKEEKKEKEFIDALRCRNGNLTIICGQIAETREEL